MNDDPTISADAMNHDPRTTDPRSPVDGDGVLPRQAVSAAIQSTFLSGDTTPAKDSGRTENHGVLMASTEAPPAGSELEPGVCAKAVSEAEAVSCPVPVRALREDDLVEGGRRLALAHKGEHPAARDRLAYDELLANSLALMLVRQSNRKQSGTPLQGDRSRRARLNLPFPLTGAQQRAIAEIEGNLAQTAPMLGSFLAALAWCGLPGRGFVPVRANPRQCVGDSRRR